MTAQIALVGERRTNEGKLGARSHVRNNVFERSPHYLCPIRLELGVGFTASIESLPPIVGFVAGSVDVDGVFPGGARPGSSSEGVELQEQPRWIFGHQPHQPECKQMHGIEQVEPACFCSPLMIG